jgi:hypothetical protein
MLKNSNSHATLKTVLTDYVSPDLSIPFQMRDLQRALRVKRSASRSHSQNAHRSSKKEAAAARTCYPGKKKLPAILLILIHCTYQTRVFSFSKPEIAVL